LRRHDRNFVGEYLATIRDFARDPAAASHAIAQKVSCEEITSGSDVAPPARTRPALTETHMPTMTANEPASITAPVVCGLGCTVNTIRSEFAEMPGMRLTRPQFRRLWNLTEPQCDLVLHELVHTGFLVEAPAGQLHRQG
jgi:hypothetical protein